MKDPISLPYRWILNWIQLPYFVLGLLGSLIALTLAGRTISKTNIFDSNFQRFDVFTSPETLFYPTASQLHALAQNRFNQSHKIAVIIGGSSIFNGVGQSTKQLWSEELQQQLGSDYVVLNLAVRSGNLQEGGAITAQALLKSGYQKVIYLADAYPGTAGLPEGDSFHKYLYWDALYKGLLIDPPKSISGSKDHALLEADENLKLLSKLDSVVYFNDLWNTLAYHKIFTVWNFTVANSMPQDPWAWMKPRRFFQDNPTPPASLAERYPQNEYNEVMSYLRTEFCKSAFTPKHSDWQPIPEFWDRLDQRTQNLIPNPLKNKSLILIVQASPYYVNRLSSAEQTCLFKGVKSTIDIYQKNGYSAFSINNQLTQWDYADPIHLSASGGEKLAKISALKVRQLAQKLGYISSEK